MTGARCTVSGTVTVPAHRPARRVQLLQRGVQQAQAGLGAPRLRQAGLELPTELVVVGMACAAHHIQSKSNRLRVRFSSLSATARCQGARFFLFLLCETPFRFRVLISVRVRSAGAGGTVEMDYFGSFNSFRVEVEEQEPESKPAITKTTWLAGWCARSPPPPSPSSCSRGPVPAARRPPPAARRCRYVPCRRRRGFLLHLQVRSTGWVLVRI